MGVRAVETITASRMILETPRRFGRDKQLFAFDLPLDTTRLGNQFIRTIVNGVPVASDLLGRPIVKTHMDAPSQRDVGPLERTRARAEYGAVRRLISHENHTTGAHSSG